MHCPKTPPTIFLPSSSLVFSSVLAAEVLLEEKLPVAADPCLSTAVNHLYNEKEEQSVTISHKYLALSLSLSPPSK